MLAKLSYLPCCTRDGGRPSEAALQGEASNYLKLLWLRAMVVSVEEKVLPRQNQVYVKEANTSEPLKKCRKRRDVVKTRGESLTWEEFGGNLYTAQAATGMEAARI